MEIQRVGACNLRTNLSEILMLPQFNKKLSEIAGLFQKNLYTGHFINDTLQFIYVHFLLFSFQV